MLRRKRVQQLEFWGYGKKTQFNNQLDKKDYLGFRGGNEKNAYCSGREQGINQGSVDYVAEMTHKVWNSAIDLAFAADFRHKALFDIYRYPFVGPDLGATFDCFLFSLSSPLPFVDNEPPQKLVSGWK